MKEQNTNNNNLSLDQFLENQGFKYHPKMNKNNNWKHDWSYVESLMEEQSIEYIEDYYRTMDHYESYLNDQKSK